MKREKNLPAEDQGDWLTEQLRDPELCVAYLNAALAEGDQAAFMLALRNVAKARGGVAAMARESGMHRVALSRALRAVAMSAATSDHSITLSARSRIVCGSLMPKALAVWRFSVSSMSDGCSIGRSPGFAPLRMRST